MVQRDCDIGPRHGEPKDHILAGGIFAARCAKEFAPGRDFAEEVFHPYPRTRWQGSWAFGHGFAVIDNPAPALFRIMRAAFQGEARNTGNARQGFAAKAQGGHLFDRIVGQLGCGVTFQRQGHLFGRGNQQFSPAVIRRLGKGRIDILASRTKLGTLEGRPLVVDTGDAALDRSLCGLWPVISGYEDTLLYRVATDAGH